MSESTDGQRPEAADASHGLRRELGVTSLVLTQILYIVGAGWLGVAATVGKGHAALWIAAVVLFFLPLAMVVAHLARLMPLEGGVYRWADAAFGPAIGFFTAWNLWCFTVAVLASMGLTFASTLAYALDGVGGFSVENAWHTRAASFVAIAIGATVASLGLRVGKWVHGAGGATHVLTFVALLAVPFLALGSGRLSHYDPFDLALPAMSLFTLNVFSKLAMGAFSGFEYIAIMAGECRDPARTIVRSVWISTPIIVAMFILGTCSVVALVPQDQLDLIAPLPQAVRAGLGDGTFGHALGSAIALTAMFRLVCNICLTYAGSVRLPMVAAWLGQAPGWLGALSQRFASPVHSAILVAALVAVLTVFTQFGARSQEAFQIIDSVGTVLYGITYVVLFSIPVLGAAAVARRIPVPVRVASLSGMVVTLLSIVLSLVPIVHVASDLLFAGKVLVCAVLLNGVGFVLYAAARRANASSVAAAAVS